MFFLIFVLFSSIINIVCFQVKSFTYQQSKLKTIGNLVNLKSLVMQEQVLEASTLIDIATNCKKLEKLCMRLLTKLYMTKVHPNSIIQNWRPELQMAFRTFFQNLGGQLKHLEFYLLHDRMQDERDMGYFEFLDNCQVLETFKLHERNTASYYFSNPREENNLMKLTKLKCLKLAEVSDNFILNYDFGNLEELDFIQVK